MAPGFIDIHTHSDLSHLIDPRAESQIRQGVTTEAIGQCGISLAPCTHESRATLFGTMGAKDRGDWTIYGELLAAIDDANIATNVVDVARESGVRLQISHVNPKYGRPDQATSNTLQMIEWARDEGIDVAMDMMPTNWNHTSPRRSTPTAAGTHSST